MSALISILMVIVIGVGSVFGFYNGMVKMWTASGPRWKTSCNAAATWYPIW